MKDYFTPIKLFTLSFFLLITYLGLTGCTKANQQKETSSEPVTKLNIDSLFREANTSIADSSYDLARAQLQAVLKEDNKNMYKDSTNKLLVLLDTIFQRNVRQTIKENEKREKAEKVKNAAALKKMRSKRDEFNDITWYHDPSSPKYRNSNGFYGYIGVSGGQTSLRLVIQYYGDDWLFIEKFIIKVDGQTFEITENSYGEIESDNDSGVWEWLDRQAGYNEIEIMKAVAYGKSAKMRIEGKQYYKDRTITPQQQAALRNVLEAFEALGGNINQPSWH